MEEVFQYYALLKKLHNFKKRLFLRLGWKIKRKKLQKSITERIIMPL